MTDMLVIIQLKIILEPLGRAKSHCNPLISDTDHLARKDPAIVTSKSEVKPIMSTIYWEPVICYAMLSSS